MWTKLLRVWLTKTFSPYKFEHKEIEPNFLQEENMGLYLHIPFCKSICAFCPYCKEIFDIQKMEKYVHSLLQEIDLKCKNLTQKKKVTSVYIGGGSPMLAIDFLPKILEKLNGYFEITQGVGIELHPNDVTEENLEKLKEMGITKISIGIQSFDKNVQNALGRTAIDMQNLKSCLEKTKFDVVSFDFIFGVKEQNTLTIKKDLDLAFQLGANCVATYPFIDFKHLNNKQKHHCGKSEKKLIDFVANYCESNNYFRNSIWTFSKENNQNYSSMTRQSFLGFGCSATSLIGNNFFINTFSVDEYCKILEQNKLPTSLVADFVKRQKMAYYLFWQAYSTRVSKEDFEKVFGKKIEKVYGFELFVAKMLGLIKFTKTHIIMTQKGSYWFYRLEQHFTLSYIDKMWNKMRQDAFPKKLILK